MPETAPTDLPTDLIEVLHRRQRRHGFLPPEVLLEVARSLALPPSHVQAVASFYHLFRLRPQASHRLGVCRGTACWLAGADAWAARLEQGFGLRLDGPERGGWELLSLGCVGACAQAPVVLLDGCIRRPGGGPP